MAGQTARAGERKPTRPPAAEEASTAPRTATGRAAGQGPSPDELGQRLRTAREAHGISLRALAKQIDVSPSFISQVELGRATPSVGTLYALVSALGLSLDDVMTEDPPEPQMPVTPAAASASVPAAAPAPPSKAAASNGAEPRAATQAQPQPQTQPQTQGKTSNGASSSVEAALLGTTVRTAFPARAPAVAAGLLPAPQAQAPHDPTRSHETAGPVHAHVGDHVQRAVGRRVIKMSGVTWERLTHDDDPYVDFLNVTYEPGSASCSEDDLMRHGGREYGHVISGAIRVQVGFETHELVPGDSINFDSVTPHRLSNPYDEPCVAIWVVVGRRGEPTG